MIQQAQQWLPMNRKIQESRSFSTTKPSTSLQFMIESKETGFNTSEGMHLLARPEQACKEQMLPSPRSLYKLPAEGVAQTEGVFSCL